MPPGTRSDVERRYYEEEFGKFYRLELLLITGKAPGDNIASVDALLDLYDLQMRIRNISVVDANNDAWSLDEFCARPSPNSPCVISTALDYLYNDTLGDWDANYLASLNQSSLLQLLSLSATGPLGNPVTPGNVMGNISYDNVTGRVTEIQSFFVSYLAWNTEPYYTYDTETEKDSPVYLWETRFIELMGNASYDHITVYYSAESSISREIAKLSAEAAPLLISSYVLVFVLVAISVSRLSIVDSHMLLSFVAIFLILFSIIQTFAFSSAVGINFTPLRFARFALLFSLTPTVCKSCLSLCSQSASVSSTCSLKRSARSFPPTSEPAMRARTRLNA